MLNRLYSYFFNKSGQVRKSFINEEGQSPWRTKVFSIFHLFVLEIFTVILKFTVLLVKPSYESFQLFTNQYTLPVCQYSYFDHKKFQKKIRLFSLAGMSTIISATIIINLVLSLFLPGQIPSYARTVNSQTGDSNLWDDWSLSTTIAGDPPSASGSTSISVEPSGSAGVSGTGTSSAIQLTSASHTFIDDGVPNNYAGLWHMDNNWNDSSGNGNNGTANDGATFNTATPRVGVAAGSFDGTGDFISIPYSSSLNIGSGNLSLEAWVKISQQGLPHHIFIMDDNNDVIKLQINISNKATFYTRDGGGDNMEAVSTTTIAVDTWYHIVGVREGTTIRIYVNGVLEHSATNAAVGNIVTTDHWHIGTGVNGIDDHVNFLKGMVDKATIYNTALSTPTISSLSNNSNLVAGGGFGNGTNSSTAVSGSGTGASVSLTKTVTANTWSTMVVTPNSILAGGSLAYDGSGSIYAFRGFGGTAFWKYNINARNAPTFDDVTISYTQYPSTSAVSNVKFDTSYPSVAWSQISFVTNAAVSSTANVKAKVGVASVEGSLPASGSRYGYNGATTSTSTFFDYLGSGQTNCSVAVNDKFGTSATGKYTYTCTIDQGDTTINSATNQWLEVELTLISDGGSTPEVDAVRATYSINANPEVCYTLTDETTCNTSASLVASLSTSSANYGHIVFNSYLRDADTTTGSTSPGYVQVGLEYSDTSGAFSQSSPPSSATSYYNSGNFATASNFTVTPITAGLACSPTGASTAWKYLCEVNTSTPNTFSQYTFDWNAKADLDARYTTTQKVRILINDQEGINPVNVSTPATSGNFTFDTSNPTATLTVNATGLATSNNQNIVLACTDNTTAFNSQYALSDDGSAFDAWNNIICNSAPTSLLRALTENAGRATPLYYKFRDYYGNELTSTLITTGQRPVNAVLQDVSNVLATPSSYKNFMSFEIVSVPVNGFASYNVYRCSPPGDNSDPTCANNANYSLLGTATPTGDRTVNYYTDSLSAGDANATFYYRFATKDSSNHISNWSPGLWGIVNGNQDAGEGGGGADSTPPVISSVSIPSASITQSSARIIWATNELANAGIFYSANLSYGSEKSSLSFLTTAYDESTNPTGRYIDLTGLSAGETYNIQLKSTDASGNLTTCDSSSATSTVTSASNKTTAINNSAYCPVGATYNFTTATVDTTPPVISGVTTSSTSTSAAVSWTTNEVSDTCVGFRDAGTSVYATEQCKPESVTSHSLVLGNLAPSTTYYVKVKSRDTSNNIALNCYANTDNASITNSDCPSVTSINSLSFVTSASLGGGGGGGGGGKSDYDAPRISGISVSDIKATSVVVTWSTNENSSSLVEYGEDQTSLRDTSGQVDSVSEHKVAIKNLEHGTKYYFKVYSVDWAGNIGVSDIQSFTTKKAGVSQEELQGSEQAKQETQQVLEDLKTQIQIQGGALSDPLQILLESFSSLVPEPIIIGGAPEVKIETASVTISWLTDKNSTSFVGIVRDDQYDAKAEEPYKTIVGNPDDSVKNHKVEVPDLFPGTKYHFQVRSKALLGETSKSKDFTFVTKSELPQILKYLQKKTDNEKTAAIYWETSSPTDSVVQYVPYGKDGKLRIKEAKIQGKPDMITDHNITISNLDPGTIYQMEISGKDPFGNLVSKTLPDFTTAIDKEPPVISQVRIESAMISGKTPKIQTIISWRTDEPSTGQAFFVEGVETTTENMRSTVLDTSISTIHTAVVTEFKPASIYRIRIESRDDSDNLAVSRDFTILTPIKSESIIDIIVKTFENTFGWVKNIKF